MEETTAASRHVSELPPDIPCHGSTATEGTPSYTNTHVEAGSNGRKQGARVGSDATNEPLVTNGKTKENQAAACITTTSNWDEEVVRCRNTALGQCTTYRMMARTAESRQDIFGIS